MKTRTQYTVLGILLVILAVVALFTVGPFAKTAGRAPAAAGTAPAADTAVLAAAAKPSLPTTEEMSGLSQWLGADKELGSIEIAPTSPILELAPALDTAGKPAAITKALPPPKLDGVIGHGQSCKAIFQDETFGVGQRIAGSDYLITAITPDYVRVASHNGPEVQLDLHK